MKRIFGLTIGVLVLLIAAQAWAQARPQNPYASGSIGFGIRPDASTSSLPVDIQNDPAFVINGAIGIELNPMIRVEEKSVTISIQRTYVPSLMSSHFQWSALWAMDILISPPILL